MATKRKAKKPASKKRATSKGKAKKPASKKRVTSKTKATKKPSTKTSRRIAHKTKASRIWKEPSSLQDNKETLLLPKGLTREEAIRAARGRWKRDHRSFSYNPKTGKAIAV